ncbi:DUF349 domain-containing protein [Pseudoalteromonas peptidolytica]|uniref:DUF349 domain-containing protein n=1 Tax=Pseudoalteromonas peptidolytica TaxID=61150 RepID=UPI00298EC77B|nr:DUF349 domain-containing protein [Pseudoalteromonas peptidolytica]MDW7550692.1 DUF349 domain-containing protein [Pseudoalteromonas peptidolytica]
MIFKHLFTPKWKHPKVDVRSQAVDKLDLSKDATLLHTLALEDESAQIRKKVLTRVNDLGLWWKVYKQDSELKELAEQKISSAVINRDNALLQEIREEYIERYAPVKTLEKVAVRETDSSNKVKLLKRLANVSLIEKTFKDGDESLQALMLDLIYQHSLEKSVLKSAKGKALGAIEHALEQQRLAKEMPAQVAEQTRVVLAKLNALRDKADFEQVNTQAEQLFAQWQSIELKWLDEETVATLDAKYQLVSEKLHRHLKSLHAKHQALQEELKAKQDQALEIAEFTAELEAIEKSVEVACLALDLAPHAGLVERVEMLRSKMASTQYVNTTDLKDLQSKLNNIERDLSNLPSIIEANEMFNQALSALKAIEAPDAIEQLDAQMQAQKDAYVVVRKSLDALPKMLQKPAKVQLAEVSQTFMSAIEPLKAEQDKALKIAKKKARDVQRLIDQGRFNVAFGVFNGFVEQYELLTPHYKKQLESQHDSLSKALNDLKDWQKYAATPKREALLSELDNKLQEEDIDPQKRAEEVKLLRARWNELGHVESDEEKAQAVLFDEKIELLFAPCRAYFAEQEVLREQAKEKREAIINDVEALLTSLQSENNDWREVEAQFNRLAKAWKSAGNVDAKVYQKLNATYRQHHQAIYEQLKAFHQGNAVEKAKLVEIAEQQLESDDLAASCELLKSLQKQWQQIGFAGAKQEHTLWKAFRAHNDAVFEKRSAQYAEQKALEKSLEAEQRQLLAELDSKVIEAVTQNELINIREELTATSVVAALKQEKSRLLSQVKSKLDDLFSSQRREKFNELVSAVENGDVIPATWQGSNKTELTAQQLILRLEILTNQPTPAQWQNDRMSQQVAMLDAKLQGEECSLETYLVSYLAEVDQDTLKSAKDRLLAILNA